MGSFGRAMIIGTLLVVSVAGCGDDDEGTADGGDATTSVADAGDGPGAAVTVKDFTFDPAALTVAPGTVVTWTNEDDVTHTATGDGFSGNLAPGGTFEQPFPEAGTFTYACAIHPAMTGTITVA